MKKAFFSVLFLFAITQTVVQKGESAEKSPFVWIAEKEGKSSYLLGTIHNGVSLDEMPCSNQVVHQIKNSDLLFLEVVGGEEFKKLSEEERRKVFIGSRAERERILPKLSLKTQEIVRERRILADRLFKNFLPFRVQSLVKEGAFLELSQKTQEILIKYGVDVEGDHADFFHFISFVAYYKAYFSLPSMDRQVHKMALSHSVEVKALDNNKQINKEISSQNSFDKPLKVVDAVMIEVMVEGMEELIEGIRTNLLLTGSTYKTYDVIYFEKMLSTPGPNEDILFKNRNELWLEKFLSAHRDYENIFLAVGLAHLLGTHNLLDMLEENGFSIERMTCFK